MPGAFQGGGSPWHKGRKALQSLESFLFLSTPPSPQHTQNAHSLELRKLKVLFRKKRNQKIKRWEKNIFLCPFSLLNINSVFISSETFGGRIILIIAYICPLSCNQIVPPDSLWQLSYGKWAPWSSDNINHTHFIPCSKNVENWFPTMVPNFMGKVPSIASGGKFHTSSNSWTCRKTSLNSTPKCIKVFQRFKSWLVTQRRILDLIQSLPFPDCRCSHLWFLGWHRWRHTDN